MQSKTSLIRDFFKRADMLLFTLCLASAIMGLVAISSATRTMGSSYIYVQLLAMIIGIVLYFVLTVIDADIFADQWPLLLVVEFGLILSLLTTPATAPGCGFWALASSRRRSSRSSTSSSRPSIFPI